MSTSTNSRRSRESATAVVGSPQSRRPRTKPFNWRRAGAWVLVAIAVVVTLAPFLWMLRTALSSNHSLASNAGNLLPADFSWGAFQRVFGLQSPSRQSPKAVPALTSTSGSTCATRSSSPP
ncbi:hypothetical protein AHiyo8_44340 [Arthrobacter sp. Hiyo8]|nr:hypothetical protein AHiyo8_44340 [Arthrobacter sp. Hiyo8]